MICVAYVYILQKKVQINTPFMHSPILIHVVKSAPLGMHIETLLSDKVPHKITIGFFEIHCLFVMCVCLHTLQVIH